MMQRRPMLLQQAMGNSAANWTTDSIVSANASLTCVTIPPHCNSSTLKEKQSVSHQTDNHSPYKTNNLFHHHTTTTTSSILIYRSHIGPRYYVTISACLPLPSLFVRYAHLTVMIFLSHERGLLWLKQEPLQSLALRFGTNSFLLLDPLY